MAKTKNDARIKQYKDAKNRTRYMFQLYCGVNDKTGKKQVTRRRGFDTREKALLALQKLEYEVSQNGLEQKQKRKKFAEIYEQWLVPYKKSVKESTWSSTVIIFNTHILPKLGNVFIDAIGISLCQKIIDEWHNKNPKTFKKYKNYTSNILKYAIHLGYIDKNCMDYVIIPKNTDDINTDKDIIFYELEQLQTFLEECKSNPFTHTFFYLIAFTGLRKSEALALEWADVDFKNNELTVSKTLSRGENGRIYISTPKTYSSKRVIDLDFETVRLLKKWKLQQKNSTYVFTNPLNNELYNPTSVRKWIDPIVKKTNLPKITPHGFRHTHASLLIEADVSLKEIQERLGHKNIQITANIYTHITKNKRKHTADKLSAYIAKG